MISTARLDRGSVLLPRAPARHGDPLSPPQPTARILAHMTPPTILKAPIAIVTLSGSSGDAGIAPIISLDTRPP